MLCLLAPLAAVGIVQAQASGGTHVDYETSNAPTIDGKWTSGTEWTDGKRENIGSSAIFYDMWTYGTTVNENIIIETLDNTNDAGDYVQICFDGANNLGSSPQTDDFLVNVTGHSTCTWYEGTGSTWSAIATPDSSIFSFAQTLGTSPVYGTTQHYMTEFSFNKQGVVNGQSFLAIQFNMRIAVYDAHSGGLGAAAFPASSTANNPSGWEYIDYSSNTNSPTDPLPIPESLSVGVIMVLSVVAVVAGAMILSKRSKIAELAGKQKSVIA
jgi:hypothetical protein